MSESEKKVSRLISYLVDTYKYKPVPITLELGDVREIYRRNLPEWCKIDGDVVQLRTKRGTPVMRGYDRIVIGDYGAFVETTTDKIFRKYIRVKSNQAFRVNNPRLKSRAMPTQNKINGIAYPRKTQKMKDNKG